MELDETYISLRNALDSLRDVTLAEYELIKKLEKLEGKQSPSDEKEKFAQFVTEEVKGIIKRNSEMRQDAWDHLDMQRAEAFTRHAADLMSNRPSLCPPGFEERDGLCVPI